MDLQALTQDLHLLGADYSMQALSVSGPSADAPLLRGTMDTRELSPGLVLYRTAVQDLCSMRTSNLLHPGVKLCLLLSGRSQLAYGNRHFDLGPGCAQGQAALVSLAETDRFVRYWHAGRSERKVTITLRSEWLAQAGLQGAGIERLWLESRCLDLIVEALSSLADAASARRREAHDGLDARNHRRLRELCDVLDSGSADVLSLQDIARLAGMSAAHLQRHFPKVGGMPVMEYLRVRRFEKARHALERGECTVAGAAAMAGYRSAANFLLAQAGGTPLLKEVVISSTRSEQNPDDLPMRIDVINAQALEEGQVRDLRDVARDQPNITVPRSPARFTLASGSTGRDQNAGFNIRGLEGNRVLMLVDGIRLPRSYVFSANAFGRDYVDVGLLQRIEVLRGATPALYGSDGMGGLVNFITADPSAFLKDGKTLGGRVSAAYDGDDDGKRLGATL
eukprot:gene2390-2342_t